MYAQVQTQCLGSWLHLADEPNSESHPQGWGPASCVSQIECLSVRCRKKERKTCIWSMLSFCWSCHPLTVRSPIRRTETEKCHNLHRMCAWHNMHCKDRRTKIECVKTKHKLATLHESSKLLKFESMDHQWSPWTIVWEKHIQLWSILVSLRCSHDGGLKGSSTAYRTAFAEFETHWEAPTIAYIAKRQKVVQEKVNSSRGKLFAHLSGSKLLLLQDI